MADYKEIWLIISGVLLLLGLLGWSIWTLRTRKRKIQDWTDDLRKQQD